MRCGVSTACLYPMPTLQALQRMVALRVPVTELFINTFSELEEEHVQALEKVQRESGIQIASLHPFSSIMEGFFFITAYPQKTLDGLKLYRRFFEICQRLGADRMVFHGDHEYNLNYFSMEQYADSFIRLARLGREYGVTLCQENVAYCRVSTAERVRQLRPLLGEYAAFVLDIKQLRRYGEDLGAMVEAMNGAIRQVHLSDYTLQHNCLPPGKGALDIPALAAKLRENSYDQEMLIEVYRDNYDEPAELVAAMNHVNALLV